MKTCPRLTVLFLSAMLVSFAGIVAAVVLHAAPQDCSRFQNEDADLLLAAAASERVSGRPGVGGGDVKLLAAAAVWTGPVLGLAVVGASCLLGAMGWAATRLAGRLVGRGRTSEGIPLAPAVAIATLAAVLLGPLTAP